MPKTANDFYLRVYEVVSLIPRGRLTTYGAIARFLGSPQAARTVGYALNKSFSHIKSIPAHRVVNRNGMLTGKHYFGGSDVMQRLLEAENIAVKDNQVLDFEKVFWDPNIVL
jgi:methylated-DNA-protein-cysteine methyltransferase related protein